MKHNNNNQIANLKDQIQWSIITLKKIIIFLIKDSEKQRKKN